MKRFLLVIAVGTLVACALAYSSDIGNAYYGEDVLKAIGEGEDVNGDGDGTTTPLMRHVTRDIKEGVDCVRILLEHGAKPNYRDSSGRTALYWAMSTGGNEHMEKIVRLLIKYGADPRIADEYGRSPIFFCGGFSLSIVKLLVDKGASVNAKDNLGFTPLHVTYPVEIMAFLISKGAKVNAKSVNGKTALHDAADDEILDRAALLIENGAELNPKMSDYQFGEEYHGVTPLHIAVIRNNEKMVRFLVEKGADKNARDNARKRPVDYAEGDIRAFLQE